VGKTRLAAVVAEDAVALLPSGGAFVDLVPVRNGFVARVVATALGVTEGSHQPLAEAVAARRNYSRPPPRSPRRTAGRRPASPVRADAYTKITPS